MSQTKNIQVDCRGRTAEVELAGDGPDVVFIGSAAPMLWSRPAAVELAAAGHRVTNFDYGDGSKDPLARTALDQVPDVLAVMDRVGIDRAVAVGLSRGR